MSKTKRTYGQYPPEFKQEAHTTNPSEFSLNHSLHN